MKNAGDKATRGRDAGVVYAHPQTTQAVMTRQSMFEVHATTSMKVHRNHLR